MNCGRNSIGNEIDADYLRMTKGRLAGAMAKLKFVGPVNPRLASSEETPEFNEPEFAEISSAERFRNVFDGTRYKHRDSSIGDSIAIELYEDLHNLHKSSKLISRIENHERVINVQNVRQGVKARRGELQRWESVHPSR